MELPDSKNLYTRKQHQKSWKKRTHDGKQIFLVFFFFFFSVRGKIRVIGGGEGGNMGTRH